MPGTTIPNVPPQFLDSNGDPLASALLFTYAAGGTTKLATYTDVDLAVPNANPIVLDSAGRATIFLTAASYKFVLAPSTDTDPPTSPIWTRDNVSAIPVLTANLDVTGTAGETLVANNAVYLSDGSGSLTAGRWYKTDADLGYASDLAGKVGFAVAGIASAASGSIRVAGRITGLSGLTIGDVYYVSGTAGAITNTRPSAGAGEVGEIVLRVVGVADSATSLLLTPADVLSGVDRFEHAILASVGNVGAGEDVLDTYNLAAGQLANDGDSVKVLFWGSTANNATGKTLKIHIDDTAVDTTILDVPLTASIAGDWIAEATILRTAAATARACARATDGTGGSAVQLHEVLVTASFTCTWANAVEIRLTGEAGANDDIQVEGGIAVFGRA